MGHLRGLEIFIALLFACLLIPCSHAQTGLDDQIEAKIAAMDSSELKTALHAAELFHTLDGATHTLDGQRFCGKYRDDAIASKDELDQLNQIRNKTTESYSRLAQDAKDRNTRALQDYNSCYAQYLPTFPKLKEAGIYTYESHAARFDSMVDNYNDIADLDAYILKLRDAIEAAKANENPCYNENQNRATLSTTRAGHIVAVITNTHQVVEVLPLGRGHSWKRVCRGHQIAFRDHIRTGPKGRARIRIGTVFDERIINMGSNTHIVAEKFNHTDPKEKTLLQMIRGNLRAVLKTAFKQDFQVRVGATLCGIRGTEVALSYDPATDIADIVLDNGDAYYKMAGGPEVTLQPRTGVTVTRGRASAPRYISDTEWSGLVQNTSLPFGVAPTPKSAETQTSTVEPPPPTTEEIRAVFARMQLRRAKQLADTYLDGLMRADRYMIDRVLAGSAKTYFDQQLGNQSLETALQNNGRPTSYDVQCVRCESDACEVTAFVRTATSPPGQGATILFSTARVDGMPGQRIIEMTGDPAKVTAFKQKGPVCSDI